MPVRIQRKRTKGWKMPENTVYVGRPTKWGNPYKVWPGIVDAAKAVEMYRAYIKSHPLFAFEIKSELAGKNLSCFCKPGEPCHADVLLEIANK